MKLKLMGKKRGMTHLFDDRGCMIPCTVVEVEPNVITQIKTKDNDGYEAVQVACGNIQTKDPRTVAKRVTKPLMGHYKKAGVSPRRFLSETKVQDTASYTVGQEVGVDELEGLQFVDIKGVSKGKGYQGLMKRNNYKGGPAAHGSGFHRHAGSTGMRSTPGRCLPGGPRPGQMGNENVMVQNVKIERVDKEKNLILLRGSVPGFTGSLLYISSPIKKGNP